MKIFCQWKSQSSVSSSVNVTFPISFTTPFQIAVSHTTSQYEDLVVTALATTYCTLYGRNVAQGTGRFIAVGK